MKKIAIVAGLLLSWTLTLGQDPVTMDPADYQRAKERNELPSLVELPPSRPRGAEKPAAGQAKGGGNASGCDCWIAPDNNYQLAMAPNDDQSSAAINLPFLFDLYGDQYSIVYINNNGNVSFDSPWATFTATGFPTASFAMVAPFWGDVDTRPVNGGEVWYRVTPTALYVNWVNVGYFNMETDKLNSFQLVLTDGNDPVIGVGKNVSFCYEEMEWTTGAASGGINGFGGTPAVVGANRGNGVDYIQFGTFDQPGSAYDGPFGNPDGIDWLDFKNFTFTTAVSTQNIPPIASSQFLCDTIVVCAGELVDIEMSFIAPEQNQTVTASSSAPTLSTYTETGNTSGNITAVIDGQFVPTPAEVGFHTINFSATDDGTPPLTTQVSIVVEVIPSPGAPPVISGPATVCPGELVTLTTSTGYDSYAWSTGSTDTTVQVGPGTYTVAGSLGICSLISDPFVVAPLQPAAPVISGVLFNCGGDPTTLGTTEAYASYVWSTGSTDPTITVGTGTYSVTVTSSDGCTGTSAPVNVLSAPDPTASFTVSPPSPSVPGSTVQFTDASTGNGASLTDWSWDFGDGTTGSGQLVDHTYDLPGIYTITLTVTTADGCTDTVTLTYTISPLEIFAPNVFSPNGDNVNDVLEFTNLEFHPGSRLIVYSRWGNVVYESSSYQNNWKATDVSDGTYFYELRLRDGRVFTGHVTILR
ncbi:MAG: gliding motility-associated C-terminal domain-containing protein [Flavobacteriales bacterium]|nr:gliding motility-associated C-terminal domain-containing protein [Flavobacteriales bacterium]